MERVGTLIHKLLEQFEQQAGPEKMAVTTQLLLAELQQLSQTNKKPGQRVSVVLPAVTAVLSAPGQETQPEKKKPLEFAMPWNEKIAAEIAAEIPTLAHQPAIAQEIPVPVKNVVAATSPVREFNSVLARPAESLNDRLKEEKTEIATALKESPIRDLKKAIGINDRFLFLHELFRGDESIYERSIRTINGFSIYPEAEYWIQRELKVKLSWPDNSETVKLFDQLVRRRFA
ncbi:MAG TPA: hypothetical protein VG842_07555 [Sediminibacterium sp.]|nr:hypothetical protein [Sediminibacterium sp.]